MTGVLLRMGRFAARSPRRVIGAWIVVGAVVIAIGQTGGGQFRDSFSIPGTESQRAVDLLTERFPAFGGGSAQVVFHARDGVLADPQTAAAVREVIDRVRALPNVVLAEDPLDGGLVSGDGTIALAEIRYERPSVEVGPPGMSRLLEVVAAGRSDTLDVEAGGELVRINSEPSTTTAELIGVLVAIVVLLLAFRSAVAAGLPMIIAIGSVAVGVSITRLAAGAIDISTSAPTIAVMLGLGAGVDYALFVVSRYRELLAAGHPVVDAVGLATATAGRAVVFAGGTVVLALLGLFATGISILGSLGLAAAAVVAVAVLAALTLLPALLGLVGHGINRLSMPGLRGPTLNGAVDGRRGAWVRWAHRIADRPLTALVPATMVLLLLAAPIASLRLGMPDAGSEPVSDTQRRAYDFLADGFGPGFNGPLAVVALLPKANGPADPANLAFLEDASARIAADPAVAAVAPAIPSPNGDSAILSVIPRTSPQDVETARLIGRLRSEILPPVVDRAGGGAEALVAGPTATLVDLSEYLAERFPLFVGIVVGLSFLLLLVVFRSIVVPLTAAVLNLLSIAAAFGVVIAAFQWGWGAGWLGFEDALPIVSIVPVFTFALLFGLSMDYHVFLLSRIREEHLNGLATRDAVATGLAASGRVITSAALVMICVFLAFAGAESPLVKMVGIGLAVAVFLDATIVRVVLVPAVMTALGPRNWWLPGALQRVLPGLDVDGAAVARAAANPPVLVESSRT